MRRIALSPRRLLAAAAIGVVGALAFASSASAHTAAVKGEAACESATGSWTVTWTVSNDWNAEATLADVVVGPEGSTISNLPTTIAAKSGRDDTTVTGTETVKAPATQATFDATATWADGVTYKVHGVVDLTGPCTASPSPSASEVVPPPASPSASAVAPVSSSPASGTGAGSTLPVTGTSLTWFVVAAVVLIGGGAALFFVSRRRRSTNA